jgi:HlyD family secretion protein
MQISLLKPVLSRLSQLRRPWLIGLLLLAAIASGVGITAIKRQMQSGQDVSALTVPVTASDVALQVRGTGTIQPIRTVNLSPKVAGRIKQLFVDQGDRVQQGQVLAKMDDTDLLAEVAQSRANLLATQERLNTLRGPTRSEAVAQSQAGVDQANAGVAQVQSEKLRAESDVSNAQSEVIRAEGVVADARSKLQLATSKLARQQALAKAGGISQQALDEFSQQAQSAAQGLRQAEAQFAQTQTRVTQAEEQVRQIAARIEQSQAQLGSANAQRQQQNTFGSDGEIRQAAAQVAVAVAQVQAAENRLAETEVRAPFDGVITQRYATVGAFVTPTTQASATGSGATSTSIFGLASGLEVLARVPEVDIARISKDQKVTVKADAFPEQDFEGKVALIAPEAVVEQSVTYFQVRARITNGLDKLRSGMNVDLSFAGEKLNNATVVPTVAIVTKRGKPGVLVPGKDNKPEYRAIEIGAAVKDQTQVLKGVAPGDRIFKELPPGMKLEDILKAGKDQSNKAK